jgi:rubrerythrin
MPNEIIDKTVETIRQDSGAEPEPEANTDGSSASDESLPFDKNPRWQSARQTEKKVTEIMDQHGYDNLDEMMEDLVSSRTLAKEVGDRDIKKLLSAQEELEKIHAYWAEQELKKKREDELPDETISRLEKQLKEFSTSKQQEEKHRKEQEEADRFWARYDNDITSFIESKDNVTGAEKTFFDAILRKDSFINNVNVQDRAEVKKMTKQVSKLVEDFKSAIIEDYRNGKIETPKMTSTQEPVTSLKETKPKNIKESGNVAVEILRKRFGFR